MDIKYINMLFVSFVAILSMNIVSQDYDSPKDKPIRVVDPIYVKSNEINYDLISKNKIQQKFSLLKDSVVYRHFIDPTSMSISDSSINKTLNNKNVSFIGRYLYATSPKEIVDLIELGSLDKNTRIEPILVEKFKVIVDENNKVMFTDGSFIVEFNTKVNFSEFAAKNSLKLIREFPDINLASFEHNDFNTLESKMSQIEMASLVNEVSYNAIDPNIIPE